MNERSENVALPTDPNHRAVVESTDKGVQAQCPCGWRGVDRCLRSDDYALTNAMEEASQHERMAQRLAGRQRKPIDIEDIGIPHLREDV